MTAPTPTSPFAATVTQPSMADVFASYTAEPGTLAAAVQQQVESVAPLVPVHVHVPGFEDEPRMRPRPYRDPLAWSLLKHAVQLALVASVVLFVLQGDHAPAMALSYVATSLLLMGAIVVADRGRFADRCPTFEIVEFLAPEPRVEVVPVRPVAPLVPLVEQMQVAMPTRVDVT